MTTTTSTTSFPPLTAVFTPAPECTTPYVYFCSEHGCMASIARVPDMRACFPSTTTNIYTEEYPVLTYSPGLFCPHGMTVASSHSNTVYCCYNGFSYNQGDGNGQGNAGECVATLTEGYFIVIDNSSRDMHSTFAFGPRQTDDFNLVAAQSQYGGVTYTRAPTIFATELAILLAAPPLPEKTLGPPLETPGLPLETGLPSSGNGATEPQVGIVVGVSIGGTLLLCFGLVLFTIYRKRLWMEPPACVEAVEEKAECYEEYMGKPELEDNTVYPFRLTKVELDAFAIRAELEGSGAPDAGAGINVIKPELQGSLGVPGLLGVCVKKKAELEAPAAVDETVSPATLPIPSPVQLQPTDIETTELADSCQALGQALRPVGSSKAPQGWI
ncbi:hypothetical protein F4803DRAFT_365035 [Xylaria telfairii]|nr:hypothetical protein F4803DRAFT_365035 [Xylaria telfairii]